MQLYVDKNLVFVDSKVSYDPTSSSTDCGNAIEIAPDI